MNIIDKIIESVNALINSKMTGTDTTATVRRIEGSTAWVHIPGGVDETPVKLTINAEVGDNVQVRINGGRAWLTGNGTAPPTDDRTAIQARTIANFAEAKADNAETVAVVAGAAAANAGRNADAALQIAGNTEQYFWHTETGTDTGAHITEVPKEDFEADPANGGGNLLARSNGIAVRDGVTELATFGASGAQIGKASSGCRIEIDPTTIAFKTNGLNFAEITSSSGLTIKETVSKNKIQFSVTGGLKLSNDQDLGLAVGGGDCKVDGDIYVGGHDSPIGSRLSAVWTASSSSASGTAMTGDITLTPGVWMLGMITPTCTATKAYYFSNISSSLSYPYFTMGTGGSGWVPVEITTNTTTHVASGASTACNYSNLTRGRILAVRIA